MKIALWLREPLAIKCDFVGSQKYSTFGTVGWTSWSFYFWIIALALISKRDFMYYEKPVVEFQRRK